MRVFDLRCAHDHRFEGWFATGEAYDDQLARGLIACPVCSDTGISRLPSAPHLNLLPAQKANSARAADGREGSRADGPREGSSNDIRNGARNGDGNGSVSGSANGSIGSAPNAGNGASNGAISDAAREAAHGARRGEPNAPLSAPQVAELQALWLNTVGEVMRKTENVGDSFAEEARRMHYKEAPERAIRGVASSALVAELADEGIDVISLPIPAALNEPRQ